MNLTEAIDRLAGFEPVPFPVISLYLNTQPDQTGRDRFDAFLRKAFKDRERTWPAGSAEGESFAADVERITRYVNTDLQVSANGVAIFACHGADGFFEALQLDAPIEDHRLYVDERPHLYPLSRLDDQYPRYVAVVADTNLARIFVCSTGRILREEEIEGTKTKRHKAGGWSQARFQRHVDNYRQQHVKEVVDALEQVVRDERIERVLLAGDPVVVPLFREQLPPHLAERIADVINLDINAHERDVLQATLEALRQQDAETDQDAVAALLDAARGSGLGVTGAADTLNALQRGQVDQLLITASPALLENAEHLARAAAGGAAVVHSGNAAAGLAAVENAAAAQASEEEPAVPPLEKVADELVTRAHQTGARVRFIEDPALLGDVGGVGAMLRFRL